jgi:nucleotide-binding universal stress UspA family protein
MSLADGLVIAGSVWLLTGVVIAVAMRRQGHDFSVWLALGCVLGLLAVPLAIERARFHPIEHQEPAPRPHVGRLDVLAGIDGSADAIAAVRTALGLFGGCVTSLTLAEVVDYDSGGEYTGSEAREEALSHLQEAADAIGYENTETTLLFGRPDQALVKHAKAADAELIVVGARGHGLSEMLFGSVTSRLVGGHDLPVFVGPRDDSDAL